MKDWFIAWMECDVNGTNWRPHNDIVKTDLIVKTLEEFKAAGRIVTFFYMLKDYK